MHDYVTETHIQFTFHEIWVTGYLVMAYFSTLNQFKGNQSDITKVSLIKLNMHHRVNLIYDYI